MRPELKRPPALRLRAQLTLATVLGIGYAPVAPGTFGSLPGLLLYWALFQLGGAPAVIAALLLLIPLGIQAASAAERHFGSEDPGRVVVDELVGQLVALTFLEPTPFNLVAGFLLFRLLDIVKPFPARRLERLHGGSGIMLDDLAAGLYANVILQLLHLFFDPIGTP